MVDALRRAHRMLKAGGYVLDLHPSAAAAAIEAGDREVGFIDADDAPLRHAAAGAALAAVVAEGLFAIEATLDFVFYTYGDTIEELRDYVADNWRDARIADETVERARGAGAARPRIRERVHATRLRALGNL